MWYLMRHPQTKLNLEKKYHGWGYSPYSELGKKQALSIIEFSKKINANSIYSSDLDRCKNLAQKMSKNLSVPLTITEDLRELNFGEWHGCTFNSISTKYRIEVDNWIDNPWEHAPTKGETLKELSCRCKKFKNNKEIEDLIVITHGGVIAMFLHLLTKNDFWSLLPNHSECILINWENGKIETKKIPLNYSKQAF